MTDITKFKNPNAETIRLRSLYRRLILQGSIRLPCKSLNGLIGPDCAYHLYKKFDPEIKGDIICLQTKNKGGSRHGKGTNI